MKNFTAETWLSALGAVAITITFAYGNFETKEHAKERNDEVVARLNRMSDYMKENFTKLNEKMDRLIEKQE
jgi:epoxyqueuosine reductase QueG